ncbi:nuclear transport factor 2 family protein [Gluconobacter sp. R75690]|uniref:nuclear transport factor 2 family protein n=1 Tax=unclassified Gluconobacter TaxID=2644261 RepID=UPI00188D2F83|nr:MULTISPECIES: nuclear transport factor 2 family protein [unclassified Gluconobacter]MBF0852425.1 nuclear transport factor 2 family protein [Gluconobacter sp. R75690]MBF0881120.1 nuclear transport factor 2 family protein [Gluconobacter sp. R75828]
MAIDLPPPIAHFIETTNTGDTANFLNCFTADAFLADWGRNYQGKAGIARWNRSDNIGVHAYLVPLEVHMITTGYSVTIKVTGKGFNGVGTMKFQLQDNQIVGLIIE